MQYITIQIPIYDTGHNAEQKRIKLLEELDEMLDEVSISDLSPNDAIAEMHDVVQVMFGYILARYKDLFGSHLAPQMTIDYFEKANKLHIAKLARYAGERDWKEVKRDDI